jgi:hypothetical protein
MSERNYCVNVTILQIYIPDVEKPLEKLMRSRWA